MIYIILILFAILIAIVWLNQMDDTNRKRKSLTYYAKTQKYGFGRRFMEEFRKNKHKFKDQKAIVIEVDGKKFNVTNLGE